MPAVGQVRRVAEGSNVLVQAVGVAPAEEERSLWLAEVTGRWFWPAASPDRLAESFLAILDAMKTRYILRSTDR